MIRTMSYRAPTTIDAPTLERTLAAARAAQRVWAAQPIRRRAAVLGTLRRLIAERATVLSQCVTHAQRRDRHETLASEVVPLADAAAFAQKRAARLLKPRRVRRGRPLWAIGQSVTVTRQPWGVVLIVGPANYPLMLPGVQAIAALAAGNAVLLKPGRDGAAAAAALAALLRDAGLPEGMLAVLDESPDTAQRAIDAGVDHIVLTGSTATGIAVLKRAAERVTPCTIELGGADAAIVLDDADLDLVTAAIGYALRANSGATCIAPRRLLVHRARMETVEQRLLTIARRIPPAAIDAAALHALNERIDDARRRGARMLHGEGQTTSPIAPILVTDAATDTRLMREDSFAPVLAIASFDNDDRAAAIANDAPLGLGATIFGSPARAGALAAKLDVGCVTINDMIVPTADPRVPFGGVKRSGIGVTRGELGLVSMTRPKAIVRRAGRFRPHLAPPDQTTSDLLTGYLHLAHGRGAGRRLHGLLAMTRAMRHFRNREPHE